MSVSNSSFTERDRISLVNSARQGFKDLENTEIKRNESKFYQFELANETTCWIKVFGDRNLFEIEWAALQKLKHNDRICTMLCSSKDFSELESASESSSLNFIVKPHFPKLLDVENKKLVLLDNAAQLIAVTKELAREGWYDWDENWENNAFDENGVLVRFDLDAAFNYRAPTPKFNFLYHSPEARDYYKTLNRVCESLDKQDFTVSSMAVRVVRFLLNRQGEFKELDDMFSLPPQDNSLEEGEKESLPKKMWRNMAWIKKLNLARKLTGAGEKESYSGIFTESDGDDAWMELWRKRFFFSSEILYNSLSEPETDFLATMWRHILMGKPSEFNLDDCYYSVLLLLAASLERHLESNEQNIIQIPPILFGELYALRNLGEEVPVETSNEEISPPQVIAAEPQEKLTIDQFVSDGGYWAATKKPNWKCQDMTRQFTGVTYPFIVLADGVSNANGFDAALVAINTAEKIYQQMLYKPEELSAEEWILKLVGDINKRLLEYYQKTKKSYQTTLSVALLDASENNSPRIFAAQFGNSPWVFFEEKEEKKILFTKTDSRFSDEKILGVKPISSKQWIADEIREISLETGKYYIRIYSDGIPENLQEQLIHPVPIEQLVEEVAQWSSKYSSDVGHDDWSIVGFDVEVKKAVPKEAKQNDDKAKSEIETVSEVAPVNFRLEPSSFKLSASALDFWRKTLNDPHYQDLAKIPIIKKTLKLPAFKAAISVRSRPPQTMENISNSTVSGWFAEKWEAIPTVLLLIVSIVLLVIGSIVSGLFIYSKFYPQNGVINNIDNTPTPTPMPETARLNDLEAQKFHDELAAGNSVTIDSLPPGSDINDEKFQSKLKNLSYVMNYTGWKLSIEVHASLAGNPPENLERTRIRGDNIRRKLLSFGVKESQITINHTGEAEPIIKRENAPNEAVRNRRIVIKKI